MVGQRSIIIVVTAIVLSLLYVPLQGQDSTLNVTIFEQDSSQYPSVTAFVNAVDTQNGSPVQLSADIVSATFGGQPTTIEAVNAAASQTRPVNLSIVMDLTLSVTEEQLQAQIAATRRLVDALDSNDKVAVTVFDPVDARVVHELDGNLDAARQTISRQVVPERGTGNHFIAAVLQAARQLPTDEPNARQIVVVLTDVHEDGSDGDSTISEAITITSTLRAPIYIIGFNNTLRDPGPVSEPLLGTYVDNTGGTLFIVPDEEGAGGIEERAGRITQLIVNEFTVQLTATAQRDPNNPVPQSLEITVSPSNNVSGSDTTEFIPPQRNIVVQALSVQNAPAELVVQDEFTFTPQIFYQDTGPDIAPDLAEVRVQIDPNIQLPVAELVAEDPNNPIITWNLDGVPGGDYILSVIATDRVGYTNSETPLRFQIEVAGDIQVTINPPATEEGQDVLAEPDAVAVPFVSQGQVPLTVTVSHNFDLQELTLEADGETIAQADVTAGVPVETEEDTFNYTVTWDTTGQTGVANVLALATDIRGNRAQDTLDVQVSVSPDLTIWLLIAFVVIIIVILVVFLLNSGNSNNTATVQSPPPISSIPSPVGGSPPIPNGPPSISPPPRGETTVQDQKRVLKIQYRSIAEPHIYPLEKPSVLLGRDNEDARVDIVIEGAEASRIHGEIIVQGFQVFYQDIYTSEEAKQRKATLLNNRPIPVGARQPLRLGDTLTIGVTNIELK